MHLPHTRRLVNGTYCLWLRIPKDVRSHYSQKSDIIQRSLKTKSPDVARDKVSAMVTSYRAEFARFRRLHKPSEVELQKVRRDFFEAEAETDRQKRLERPDLIEIVKATRKAIADGLEGMDLLKAVRAARDPLAEDKRLREWLEGEVKKAIAGGRLDIIDDVADEIIARNSFLIAKGSPEYREFCHDLVRASLEVLKMAAARDKGEWSYTPEDDIIGIGDDAEIATAPAGETITDLFERYIAGAKLAKSTEPAYRQSVHFFAEFVGEATHVKSAFTKTNAREFKFALEKLPVKASESKAFRGMSFPKIIKANETVEKPVIKLRRVGNLITACSSFANWLHDHGYIDDNPFRGLAPKITKDEKEENKLPPFTVDQLKTLFASSLYTGALSTEKPHQPGKVAIRDHRYWMPLLGLFTGSRVGEIAMIEPDDVQEHKEGGKRYWVIWMPCEKQERSARRVFRPVPIHSALIRFGFMDYVRKMKKAEGKRLFPEIRPNKRGEAKGHYDDEFRRYLERVGIKKGRDGLGFHSFRHTFIDAARRAGVRDADTGLLVGHGKQGMTAHYGTNDTFEGTIPERAGWIEKVQFDVFGTMKG